MDSDSSSGSGTSPTRFRPQSPSSDTESVAQTPRKAPVTTFHPSAASQAINAPVLRQPVGFGASPPPVPTYRVPPPEKPTTTQHNLPGQRATEEPTPKSTKKSTKSKDNAASKEKSKASSRKGKELDKADNKQPHVPIQRTSFRVRKYMNDPTAGATPYGAQDGPYGSTYRVNMMGDSPRKSKSSQSSKNSQLQLQTQSVPRRPTPPSSYYYPWQTDPPGRSESVPSQAQSGQDTQPRKSYYRWDYEEPPPIVAALQAANAASATSHSSSPAPTAGSAPPPAPTRAPPSSAPTPAVPSAPPPAPTPVPPPAPPSQNRYPSPRPPHNPEPYSHDLQSSKRHEPPMQSTTYRYSPSPEYDHRDDSPPSLPPEQHYSFPPPRPPPGYVPAQSAPNPPPSAPPQEKRHKSKSQAHHHEPSHYARSAPQHPVNAPVPPIRENPPPATRMTRVLTLLMEDKRNRDDEQMLAEVRVPLKPAESGDEGFWADAQEVSQELQKGPSRIDGAAKVYTMRGKYKQYFLRITADGQTTSQPANLRVSAERTLEIVVEDNLPAGARPSDSRMSRSPPRHQRELLTPVTESMATPSPLPAYSQPKRSSLFSTSDASSPTEDRFDPSARKHSASSEASRKRPRPSSGQSMHSTYSEGPYAVWPQQHATPTPFTHPPPPMRTHSASHSRNVSQSAVTPQSRYSPPAPMSPISRSARPSSPPSPRAYTASSPPQPAPATPAFIQSRRAGSPAPSSSAYSPGPSSPKRAKFSAPQHRARERESESPAPSPSTAYSWSHSRTSSYSESSGPATSSKDSTPGPPPKKPNPFEQYGSSFSFQSRQTDTSRSTPRQNSGSRMTLPSIPSLSTVSMPSSSFSPSLTLAPIATSLAPTLSGASTSALDNAIGLWIRGIISKEPQWDSFVTMRTRLLKMSEQLEQYKYVQRVMDRYVGTRTPVDLEGAGGVTITKAQVMRAFNLSLSWGEDCTETLVLTTLYGPGGTRREDERVCQVLEETPPITTGMQAKKYLTLLREVHGQWTIAHPDG